MSQRNQPSSQGPRHSRTIRRPERGRPGGRACRPRAEALEGRELLAVAIAEIPLPDGPTPGASRPVDIVAGADGNLWITENPRAIVRLTPGGAITEFPVPGTGYLGQMAAGPDGNVWFLDVGTRDDPVDPGNSFATEKIGKITPAGVVTEYPLSTDPAALGTAIALGPDGNLWAALSSEIDRITPAGAVTSFPYAARALVAGADGNLWFVSGDSTISKMTTDGVVTTLPTTWTGQLSSESAMVALPDGTIEVPVSVSPATPDGNHLLVVSPAGVVTDHPEGGDIAYSSTIGPGGHVWETELVIFGAASNGQSLIEGTDLDGHPLQLIPPSRGNPGEIAAGPAGDLWFTEPDSNRIGQVDLNAPDPGSLTVQPAPPASETVGLDVQGPLASFTPLHPGDPAGDYVAQIQWDDSDASQGTITPDGNGGFVITGSHLYPAKGTYPITVTITDVHLGDAGATGVAVSSVVVADAILHPHPVAATESRGQSGPVVLGTVTSLNLEGTYTATIDWGDGSTSTGELAAHYGSGFTSDYADSLTVDTSMAIESLSVAQTHTYTTDGTYNVRVTVEDQTGRETTVLSTLQQSTPAITATHTVGVQAKPGVSTGTITAGSFDLSATGIPAGQFMATIRWGDDSTLAIGSVVSTGPSTYAVQGSHVYAEEGTYPIDVTIFGFDRTVVLRNQASVEGVPVPPSITATHAVDVQAKPGVSTGPLAAASFGVSDPDIPAGQFAASIDWGDGSAPVIGTIISSGPSTYTVQGSHAYKMVGSYPIDVTIFGVGQPVIVRSQAHVAGAPLAVSGGLDPASDTGYSNHDGVTNATQPHFQGVATPGTTVELFARPADGSAPRSIGRAVAGGNGVWSIVSTRLAEGTYAITANVTAADGRQLAAVPIPTRGTGGRLVIDTTGPRITGATLDPGTGQVRLTFRDNLSQVNPLGLVAAGALHFSRITAAGATAIPARVSSIRPGGGSVTLGPGHSLASGRYALQVQAGSVRDAAGNALDGEFRGLFPTGDGHPGGGFVAGFVTRGTQSTPALPLVAEPPQQSAHSAPRKNRHHLGS